MSKVTEPNRAAANQMAVKQIFNMSIEAPIREFQSFYEAMNHPAATLLLDVSGDLPVSTEKDKETAETGNHIVTLCDEVLTSVANFESSMGDFNLWKNEFLKQSLPSGVKLTFITLFSRLLRRYAQHLKM